MQNSHLWRNEVGTMRKRELIRAMLRHEKVRAMDPLTKHFGELCTVKRVSYFVRETGRVSIGAELRGYKSVYHTLAKYVKLAREVERSETQKN